MVLSVNSAKTICSICYEDLRPVVEDLQAISICGHVFHELCLHQWFEYCESDEKCSCPVCKQKCSLNNVVRLYFQSVADQLEKNVSHKGQEALDAEFLRLEVSRLESNVASLSSSVDRQGKEINELNGQLCLCKDKLNKQILLKNNAMEQKSSIQQVLASKSQELDTIKLDFLMLQDRNMALAKELAALKLVSDVSLGEDEILKLATLGNDANSKDTIDILRKSLIIRNRSYKELITKCNQLGREGARSNMGLEKAKQKINKLKARIHDLEVILESKENAALRTLKLNVGPTQERAPSKISTNNMLSNSSKPINDDDNDDDDGIRETILQQPDNLHGLQVCMSNNESHIVNPYTKKESQSPIPPSMSGNVCFLGGLLGPDGTNRYLGKWCKRAQNCGSVATLGSDANSGDLISVGSDGRGGRIKILRSLNKSSPLNGNDTSASSKRYKPGAKTGILNSQGFLQIEHFFGNARTSPSSEGI